MNGSRIAALSLGLVSLLGGLGACDVETESEFATEESEFRYIPTYEDTCVLEDKATQLAVRERFAQAATAYDWRAATTMEMCDETSCAPCNPVTNRMLQVLRTSDSWGSDDLSMAMAVAGEDFVDASNPFSSPLEVYLNRALDYPWRRLMLGRRNVFGFKLLTLAQGIHKCADGTYDCDDYRLAVESLDASCESMPLTMPVHQTSSRLLTLAPNPNSLGFQVPLTPEFPAVSSFENTAELEVWLQEVPRIQLEMSDISVDWRVSGDGGVCATVRGRVDADAFDSVSATPTSVDVFADADGKIPTALSLQLSPADVDAG